MLKKIKDEKKKTSKVKNTSTKFNGKNKKIVLGVSVLLIVLIVLLTTFLVKVSDKVVITIDNIQYTEKDFNMYAYLVKYEYFGIDGTNVSDNTLNTQVSNDSNITIGEYLKEQTVSKIKISAAILRIAEENNVTLTKEDLKEVKAEKEKFIKQLGGKKEFKKLLKDNNTTENSYMKAAKSDKLYSKIFDELYDEGKRNDLTTDELQEYKTSYKNDYVKIKQIVLLRKDLTTGKYLDDTTLNQKEILANALEEKARAGENFDKLIKKYSEGFESEVKSEYYLKSDLVEELRKAINLLNVGDISGVIRTDNAYHIVIKEKLDEFKLEDYYDSKREEKLIKNINDNLEKIKIIKSEYLEKITVK